MNSESGQVKVGKQVEMSQCRFRSKMNSEMDATLLEILEINESLNAASAAR